MKNPAILTNTGQKVTSACTEQAIGHRGILGDGIDVLHKPYSPSVRAENIRVAPDREVSQELAQLIPA